MKRKISLFVIVVMLIGVLLPSTLSAKTKNMPEKQEIDTMVKKALVEFNQAVQKKDFSDFQSQLAKAFKDKFSPDDLKNAFQVFINKKIDFSDVNDSYIFLSQKAIYDSYGDLILKGFAIIDNGYPNIVEFALDYRWENDKWKLIQIEVKTHQENTLPRVTLILNLIEKNLLLFNNCVQIKNFIPLRNAMTTKMQNQYSAEELRGIFKVFMDKEINFETVTGKHPYLIEYPDIVEPKTMNLKGEYHIDGNKSKGIPAIVEFEFTFIKEDGKWNISYVNINTK